MTAAMATAALIAAGVATRYNPGVMDVVVSNRILYGQLPEGTEPHRCLAVMDCDRIGQEVWLELPTGQIHGPYIVADCAARQDRDRLEALGFAVDLNFEAALRLGVIDRPLSGVRVWDRYPYAPATEPRPQ